MSVDVDAIREHVRDLIRRTTQEIHDPRRQRTPSDLIRMFKYPDPLTHERALVADVFESVLMSVVNGDYGDLSPADVLTAEELEFLAALAGCVTEEEGEGDCDDICELREYRSASGECNNLRHPSWGSGASTFFRVLPPQYDNPMSFPRGHDPAKLYNGFPLPSARAVSVNLVSAPTVNQDADLAAMLMQWGQFLDHDLDLAPIAVTNAAYDTGVSCTEICDFQSPCFGIPVPDNDPRITTAECIPFTRSSAQCTFSPRDKTIVPRETINEVTGYMDASQVYGSSEEVAHVLRELSPNEGLLKAGVLAAGGKPLLPPDVGQFPIECGDLDPNGMNMPCFIAGDVRVNEMLGLLSMHTIWFREHNRIVKRLHELNPHWDGDRLYQEARKIVIAQEQRITYDTWLPLILGPTGMDLLGLYTGYDPSVHGGVSNEFATAAFRMGHTLIPPITARLDCNFQTIPQGNLSLHQSFFAPHRIFLDGGIDPILRGLLGNPVKQVDTDEMLNTELTEKLFALAHDVALDLASLNIQRSRDHGLAPYNTYREHCGLGRASTFADLQTEISNPDVLQTLEQLYGHVDNIDLWPGCLSEERVPGAVVGPTFLCLLAEQFKRTRAGDRFWYENPGVLTPGQLSEIKQATLSRVICDNGDDIEHVPLNAFRRAAFPAGMVTCDQTPYVDLRVWRECCQDDQQSEQTTDDDDNYGK